MTDPGFKWPAVLLDFADADWDRTSPVPCTRFSINGCVLTLTGVAVATDEAGMQSAVDDPAREDLLLQLSNPEAPWQTWRDVTGVEYALYAVPAQDQDGAVAAAVELERRPWSGFAPEFEERDRKFVSVVVQGHCALHLEARRVVGTGQQFASYPEDRDSLAALAGWDGPFPTVRIDEDDFVLFASPYGR